MLGGWALTLFDKRKTGSLLSIGAIARYIGSLSPRFESLLYSVDLRALDEEELTDQVHKLLVAGDIKHPEYVKHRLQEFFEYGARAHGLASPNWNELHVEDKAIGISPGYISFSTYCRLITRVRYRAGVDDATALRAALFTMLSYRFGLRKGEASGMRWRDWIDIEGLIYVIINDWKERDVKSNDSRRVVPLLWSLTSFEKRLLEEHSVLMKVHVKTYPKALFLSYPADPARKVDADFLSNLVTSVLKSVGGRHLTEHHLRHTFAANVWAALERPLMQAQSTHRANQRRRLQLLLMQSSDVGRRGPWAIARLLGHSHPAQSYKSYIHFLCDFSDHLTFSAVQDCDIAPRWAALQNLDDFPVVRRPQRTRSTSQESRRLSVREVIWTLRLLAEGQEPDQVSRALRTSAWWVTTASTALHEIESRVFPAPKRKIEQKLPVKESRSDDSSVSKNYLSEATQAKFVFRKLGASGLLSHVLQSKLESITALLETAFQGQDELKLPTPPASEDFVAAFGPRLQVSLWNKSQLIFFRWAFELFEIERGRLTLLAPPNLHQKVLDVAQATGWISGTASDELTVAFPNVKTWLFPLTIQHGRQDIVKYGELEDIVQHRLSVQMKSEETGVIGNRYELVFCHLIFWLWCLIRTK
jgi:integrase